MVSAKQKSGLDELLEKILLQSEVLELKSNPNRSAEGVVVEAQMQRGLGEFEGAHAGRGRKQALLGCHAVLCSST